MNTGPGGPGPAAASPGGPASGPPLTRNRGYGLLWSGQAVSALGTQISIVAYPLLILTATGSAAEAGLVSGAALAGILVTLLPAGVVADRYPPKRIMTITSVTGLAAAATVAVAVRTGHVILAHLAVAGFAQGVAEALCLAASRGAIRKTVPGSRLSRAMARTRARDQSAAMAGPPLGGALFGISRALPFAADAVSFAALALAVLSLRGRPDPVRAPDAGQPLRRSVSTGVRYVLAEPSLRMAALWGAMVNAIAAGMLLMVIVLARDLGAAPPEIGGLMAVNAAGGLAGSFLSPRLIRLLPGRTLALITSWLLPLCAVGIAGAPWVWLIGVMGAVTTFAVMPVNVVLVVRSARVTPDRLRGQVAGAQQLLRWSVMWAAPPAFGALADRLGPPPAVFIAAGLYAAGAVWLQFSRALHRLNDQQVASPAT